MAAREEDPKRETARGGGVRDEDAGAEADAMASAPSPSRFGALLVPDALVRMGIGVLVLSGLTAGTFFLVTDVIGPALGPVESAHVAGTLADGEVPPVVAPPGDQYMIEEIVLNPAGSRGKRFLRLGVCLETEDGPSVLAELDSRRAQVRDLLIRKFSARTIDELSDPTVREEIRLSCIDEINAALASGTISSMYFTDYVLQ